MHRSGEEWGGSSQREKDTGFQMGRTDTHKDVVLGSLPRAEPGVGLRDPALSPVAIHGPLGEYVRHYRFAGARDCGLTQGNT